MILGVGLDIQEIAKIAVSTQTAAFVKKVFTQSEVALCTSVLKPEDHFAGKFAAKEAFMKAIGAGIRQGIWFTDIEILNRETGAPYIQLYREAEHVATNLGVRLTHVSISHSAGIAAAVVILES